VSVDLSGENAQGFVGYRAKRHTGVVNIDRRRGYAVDEFWEAISARPDGSLILDPREFYIWPRKRPFRCRRITPRDGPFDPLVGEFCVLTRASSIRASAMPGAAERVRAGIGGTLREVPFILEHGQIVGRLGLRKNAGAAAPSTARHRIGTTRRRLKALSIFGYDRKNSWV